jgi:hypothetical protein
MTVKNPVIFQCAICPATLDTGTASEEKAGQFAAKQRWVLGLPHGNVWCERCSWLRGPYSTGTV